MKSVVEEKDQVTLYLVIFSIRVNERVESYAIEIDKVHEIRAVENITRVPNTTNMLGVMNLRGKIISVVDMKYILGFGNSEIDQKQRILIVEVKGNTLGLLVDDVEQVLKIPLAEVEFNMNVLEDVPYIRGIVKMQDKLILILDLERLFGGVEG